jgi:ribosomal protein S18 acetylase RimI-like enzyme
MPLRVATVEDVDAVASTIALAFANDPVWGPALARADGSTSHLEPFWRLYVEGALRHSTIFMSDGAVAVWIPPDATELSPEQESSLEAIVAANLEPESQRAMLELWERFDSNHPHDKPHAYLSLLATHPDHRGRGVGMALLAESLNHFAVLVLPAYLESTNPANNRRYESAGFVAIGGFRAVLDDAPITTMWREVPES